MQADEAEVNENDHSIGGGKTGFAGADRHELFHAEGAVSEDAVTLR